MNIEQQKGYFSEEQLDRANLKTMANPLPVPWNGSHLLALLVYSADLGVQMTHMTPEEAKQECIDWYCQAPVDKVVEALETMSKEPEFQTILQIQEYIHREPERFEEALDAIARGWRPGDPR